MQQLFICQKRVGYHATIRNYEDKFVQLLLANLLCISFICGNLCRDAKDAK